VNTAVLSDRALRHHRVSNLGRRMLTVPGFLLAWLGWFAAAPLWLPLAAAVDLVRRNGGVALRSAAVVSVYLTCEVLGIFAAAGLWIWKRTVGMDPDRWTDVHFRLEAWWGATLFRAVEKCFDLRLEVVDAARLGRGPYLLMVRHASAGDTLLAAALVSRRYGVRLRYVLKSELLWDPSLDLVGHRIPNVFVERGSDDSEREVRRVRELGRGLGLGDGVLIYPEGTRFSEAKRRRLLDRFREKGDSRMLAYALSLGSVLPPRHAGILALLDAAPHADVVVCAHTGFEGAASLAQIWNGALLHQTIRVHFRRVPREEIPAGRDDRIVWLRAEWRRVDEWVEAQAQ